MLRFLLAFTALAGVALAHHSVAADFDISQKVEYPVTVETVSWMNPHVTFTAVVKTADGKSETWTFEMAPPNSLVRLGWPKTTVQVGDKVTVTAYPGKNGAPKGSVTVLRLADGRTIENKGLGWPLNPQTNVVSK